MNNKTLRVLEYDKILNLLYSHATSDAGRAFCMQLKPSTDISEITSWQHETTDACSRIRMKGPISFGSTHDITESIKRLEVASTLSLHELLHISSLLSNCARVISYGRHEDDTMESDSLEVYFRSLDALPTINKELSRCIIAEDTIADDASSELLRIRKQHQSISGRMHSELQNILQAHRNYLMDSVIAMRDGAYCLPIKSEYKNKVPGVVHDQSSSGSTVFIEPMAVINMSNSLRELEMEEKREIEVILENLSNMLIPYIDVLTVDMHTMAHLDFVWAKAGLSSELKSSEPKLNTIGYIDIRDGRHPLLQRDTAVPISVSLGNDYNLLVVTGPNTGGKTVSLKTIGLFTLMGQSGLHIPAFEGSSIAVFDDVFADIGDEQSIEQSLSTFSGHMKSIVDILAHADSHSLCLFDELCAGTDPTEGAALAISILSFLHNMQTRTVATTHYSELKVFALTTPGVVNASCEFDIETLRPTYRIIIGIPGKSNAFAISQKLGLPSYIIDDARTHIEKDDESLEDLLSKLDNDRIVMEQERAQIAAYKKQIEELKTHYERQDENLDDRREQILSKARQEATDILSKAKETADSTIRHINKIASGAGLGSALEAERSRLRDGLKEVEPSIGIKLAKPNSNTSSKRPKLKLGDSVRVLSMNLTGTVSSLPNEKGLLFVRMGILRSQVNIDDIELIDDSNSFSSSKKVHSGKDSNSFLKASQISPEINLIGKTVDEACAELDKYLDDALLSHVSSVRIIHGRGTGALKAGIHAYLKKQPYVREFHLADFDDGADAVTVVTF